MRIITTYVGATDTAGSKIVAKGDGRQVTIPYPYAESDPHLFAARELVRRGEGDPALVEYTMEPRKRGHVFTTDRVHTWADGFGVWHARVPRGCVGPLLAARRALRDELLVREDNVARWVWAKPVRVPALDTVEGIVYRESDSPRINREAGQ